MQETVRAGYARPGQTSPRPAAATPIPIWAAVSRKPTIAGYRQHKNIGLCHRMSQAFDDHRGS